MATVNLAKALKMKNVLAGEIRTLRETISNHNVKTNTSKQVFDVTKLIEEMEDKVKKLIELKTSIAKANVGIYELIERMKEAKGKIAWLSSLPIREGKEIETSGYGSDRKEREVEYISTITEKDRFEIVNSLNIEISNLQDEIDKYNATTTIEV